MALNILYNQVKLKKNQKKTNIEKYGVDNAMKRRDVVIKQRKSLYENGSCPASNGQKNIHRVVGGILNYPCDIFNLDVFIPEILTYIEYNGSGHEMCISRYSLTREEFINKENFRYEFLKKLGLKMIEIKNISDVLPSDEIILEEIESALDLLNKENLDYVFIDFDILKKWCFFDFG